MHKINTLKKRIEKLHGEIEVGLLRDKLEKEKNDYYERGYHKSRQTDLDMGWLAWGFILIPITLLALPGMMEILKAFGNFLYSIWIILLILSFSITIFESWRFSKEGIKGVYKFERIVFAVSFSITFMIILAILLRIFG